MKSIHTLVGITSYLTTFSYGELLAYYSFDTDFLDSSGSLNHLIVADGDPAISNADDEYVFGGGALDLAGSGERLDLTTAYNFSDTDTWSVSFWARRRPEAGVSTGMVMGDSTTTASFIWNTANAGQVDGLRFRPASGGVGNGNNDFATGTDTDFHHWVLVADGTGQITVYRDNVSLGASTATGGTPFDINSIGQGYNNAGFTFDGQLDEIYIFDEVIDEAKVEELFVQLVADPKIAEIRHQETSLELDLKDLDSAATYKVFRDVALPLSEAKVQVGADITSVSTLTVIDPGPLPSGKAFYRVEKQ